MFSTTGSSEIDMPYTFTYIETVTPTVNVNSCVICVW